MRTISRALLKKGFVKVETSHHTYYRFTDDSGEFYDRVRTYVSRGDDKDIDNKLLLKMAKQMQFDSRADLEGFIDCAIGEETYREILRKKGEHV